MIERTYASALRVGLVLVVALAAAVVTNFVLLGVATGPNDPVGRLSPRAGIVEVPATTPTPRAAPTAPAAGTTTAEPSEEPGSEPSSDD